MGYYTRIKFVSVLQKDALSLAVDVLSAVAAGDWSREKAIAPNHEFFNAERWTGSHRPVELMYSMKKPQYAAFFT